MPRPAPAERRENLWWGGKGTGGVANRRQVGKEGRGRCRKAVLEWGRRQAREER